MASERFLQISADYHGNVLDSDASRDGAYSQNGLPCDEHEERLLRLMAEQRFDKEVGRDRLGGSTEILCLANSYKHGGRCLAGLTWPDLKTWIRPVDPGTTTGEVPKRRASVATGRCRRSIKPLDVIRVELTDPVPEPAQPENYALGGAPIQLVDVLKPADISHRLRSVTDPSRTVFDLSGRRRIDEAKASRGLSKSIALYEVDAPKFYQDNEGKWRTDFRLNKIDHRKFPITDLDFRNELDLGAGSAVQREGRWLLTISLGTLFNHAHWLLIAAVIPSDTT